MFCYCCCCWSVKLNFLKSFEISTHFLSSFILGVKYISFETNIPSWMSTQGGGGTVKQGPSSKGSKKNQTFIIFFTSFPSSNPPIRFSQFAHIRHWADFVRHIVAVGTMEVFSLSFLSNTGVETWWIFFSSSKYELRKELMKRDDIHYLGIKGLEF